MLEMQTKGLWAQGRVSLPRHREGHLVRASAPPLDQSSGKETVSPNEILITRSVAPFASLAVTRSVRRFSPARKYSRSYKTLLTPTCGPVRAAPPPPQTPTHTAAQGVDAGGKILSGPLATSVTNTAFPPTKCSSDLKLGRLSTCFREAKVTDLPEFPSSPEPRRPGTNCCGRAELPCLPGRLSA